MREKIKKFLLSVILVSILCFTMSTTIVRVANASEQNSPNMVTSILFSNNATSTSALSPFFGSSAKIIKVNSSTIPTEPVLPSTIANTSHYLTPGFISNPNGTITELGVSPQQGSSDTWLIDYWATSQSQVPSYLEATFTVAPDTFNNLPSGGYVDNEPLNVCFGSSSSDYIWYQFVMTYAGDGAIGFGLCVNPSWQPNVYYNVAIGIQGGMIIGDSYECEFWSYTSNGSPFVMFGIENLNTQADWDTNDFNGFAAQGTSVIYQTSAYSPASCVETNLPPTYSVTNCPFLESTIDPLTATCGQSGSAPPGIETAVTSGSGNYYWSMLSQDPFYVSGIITSQTGGIGDGSVSNAGGLIGNGPDGNYANIYGGNPGDGGQITGQMSGVAGGNIQIYGYSTSGYYSNLYVYVSMDDSTWYQIGNYVTVSSSTAYWISIGYYADFKYIAVCGYDSYDSVNLHLDCVKVSP